MEIFDKVGPLGETLKGGGGLKNPIKQQFWAGKLL